MEAALSHRSRGLSSIAELLVSGIRGFLTKMYLYLFNYLLSTYVSKIAIDKTIAY